MTRDRFNRIGAWTSVGLAALSFGAALWKSSSLPCLDHKSLGIVIVAFWAVAPPVFFWFDWVHFCRDMDPKAPEREIAKHTHDLGRNIWIALVTFLTLAFFKLP